MKKLLDLSILREVWEFAIEEDEYFETKEDAEEKIGCKIGDGYENENVYSI